MLAHPAPRVTLDASLGVFGAALIVCAVAFALFGTPPIVPAPMVLAGIPSPLTGMTRSFVAIASGDIARAVWFHPLGPALFAACLFAPVSALIAHRTGRRPAVVDRFVRARWTVPALVTALALAWVRQIVVFG